MHGDGLQVRGLDARRGPARERLRRELAVAHDAHAVRELGDQQIAVRHERDVARIRQAFGDRHEPHAKQLAGRALALRLAVRRARARHPRVEHERIGRRRRRCGARSRARRRALHARLHERERQQQRIEVANVSMLMRFRLCRVGGEFQSRYFQVSAPSKMAHGDRRDILGREAAPVDREAAVGTFPDAS